MASASISFNSGTTTSLWHNNRLEPEKVPHVNMDRINDNVFYIQEDIRKVYEREFSEAVSSYNEKQKRKDRKIDDYYRKILHDEKTHHQRELIVAVGKMDDGISEKAKFEILDNYARGFQERNLNLVVYNSVLHMDEANPHLHINYVPVFESIRGLSKRVGHDKAIQQQGYKDFKEWRTAETAIIEQKMMEYGLERRLEGSHGYMKPEEYKNYKEELKELKTDLEQAREQISELRVSNFDLKEINQELELDKKKLEDDMNITTKQLNSLKSDLEAHRDALIGVKVVKDHKPKKELKKGFMGSKEEIDYRTAYQEIKKIANKSIVEIVSLQETVKEKDEIIESRDATIASYKKNYVGQTKYQLAVMRAEELESENEKLKSDKEKFKEANSRLMKKNVELEREIRGVHKMIFRVYEWAEEKKDEGKTFGTVFNVLEKVGIGDLYRQEREKQARAQQEERERNAALERELKIESFVETAMKKQHTWFWERYTPEQQEENKARYRKDYEPYFDAKEGNTELYQEFVKKHENLDRVDEFTHVKWFTQDQKEKERPQIQYTRERAMSR